METAWLPATCMAGKHDVHVGLCEFNRMPALVRWKQWCVLASLQWAELQSCFCDLFTGIIEVVIFNLDHAHASRAI